MVSTEDIYESIGMTEADILEFMNKYTFGSNEFSGIIGIARFAATLAFEVAKKQKESPENKSL